MLPRVLVLFAAAFAAAGSAHAQNLVSNGGFESPDISGIQFFGGSSLGGWTSAGGTAGGSGYVDSGFVYNTGALPGPLAYQGSQYLYLNNAAQSGVTLSQSVNVVAGDPYRLSFAHNGISYLNGTVGVSLGPMSFGSFAVSASQNTWSLHLFNFVATSGGPLSLVFESLGGAVTLDEVSLVSLAPVVAVPEPEVYLSLLGGLVVLTGHANRRRRQE